MRGHVLMGAILRLAGPRLNAQDSTPPPAGVLNQREADLVALSSVGKLVIATESDHEIQLYQPDLVVQAIRDVIGEVHAYHRRARNHL